MTKPIPAIVDATFVAGVAAEASLPPPALAEVAFAGRSNVGKSSLMNTLLGRRHLVRTGSTPGTTRQLNLFAAKAADGLELVFVDLPGYGYARRAKSEKSSWGPLIEGYLERRVTLRALVLIVDVRRGLEPDDRELLEFVRATDTSRSRPSVATILVATKTDKLGASARKPALDRLARAAGIPAIGFSAVSGEGRDELWRRIRAVLALGTAQGT
jgi:GTP-binding protein